LRDLDLTSLRLFVSVCETGNIARAGEKANLVGSAISKRLAQLEDTVGTPLLTRKRHGVAPTAAGQTLLEHARSMLAYASMIERDMGAYGAGVRGQVRIFASASAMAESLADDVAAFLRQPGHQDIQVDMEERVSPDIVRGIRGGMAALGVCWDAADIGSLQSKPYRTDRLCMVVPKGHKLAAHKQLRYADTLDYEQVSLPAASAVQVMLLREAALRGRTLRQRVVVSNFESALRVVRAGLAVSMVPREVAEIYAQAYGLKIVPLQDPWAERRFIVVYRDEASLPPAARQLADYLGAQAVKP
jgi:DNA-binding transcriptional LysR family regulator